MEAVEEIFSCENCKEEYEDCHCDRCNDCDELCGFDAHWTYNDRCTCDRCKECDDLIDNCNCGDLEEDEICPECDEYEIDCMCGEGCFGCGCISCICEGEDDDIE